MAYVYHDESIIAITVPIWDRMSELYEKVELEDCFIFMTFTWARQCIGRKIIPCGE